MDDLPPDITEREAARWKGDVMIVLFLAAALFLAAVLQSRCHHIDDDKPVEAAGVGEQAR